MKCDKLQAYKGDVTIPVYGTIADAEVYLKKEADEAIAELKKKLDENANEIAMLKERICNGDVSRLTWIDTCLGQDKEITELKDKCQMHDFFWEGCGFAKRGFKNSIAVSEAFDRLEAKNIELQSFYDLHGNADNYIDKLKAENAELKKKLENVQASMYADVVDANMKVRMLRRALYKACANWAHHRVFVRFNANEKAWENMERKCLAKAESYL